MKSITAYFLLFALIQIHILETVKGKSKLQHIESEEDVKEGSEDKEKPTHESSQSKKTSEMPEEDSQLHTSKAHSSNKKVGHSKVKNPCKSHKPKGPAAAARHKNITGYNGLSLPIQSSYPNEFGPVPIDVNSPGQPDQSREETELGYHGHLYDVFQKRLNQVFRELYYNVNSAPVTQPTPQKEYENEKPKKRSAVSNCLNEEFKRRLDKFNNEFLEPAKAIKRTSNVNDISLNAETKRATVQENVYEEYKRRLDKLDNELWFDGEKVFDRNGRGAPSAGMLLLTASERNERKQKRGDTKKVVQQDFYEDYKKKLDQLTRELYQKSNERISRENSYLTEQDLTSPTLQRLVTTVQLDDAKSVTGNARDASGSFEGSTMLLKIDKAIDNFDKQPDKRSLGATDLGKTIFGADSLNFMTGIGGAASPTASAAASASYPSVLTKTVDTNLGLLGNPAPKNLLATVASKMNITTLDLAKKLAAMSNPLGYVAKKDPTLGEEMQKFIDLTVNNQGNSNHPAKKAPINEVAIVSGLPLLGPDHSGVPKPLMAQDAAFSGAFPSFASCNIPVAAAGQAPQETPCDPPTTKPPPTLEPPCDPQHTKAPHSNPPTTKPPPATTKPPTATPTEPDAARIAGVLDKVLGKLEVIQSCKGNGEAAYETCEPDGVPCDVTGSWNSAQMGLRFDITLNKASDRRLAAAEKNNKLLTIEVGERMPPHAHHIIDTSWKFMGSALNQLGGPFYIYSQNRELGIVTTFIGYCRVCGDIDTIFGSWTIMGPSKDCEDVTTALENKRDVFRRYNMENKRNRHFKDMLFEKSKYSKPECERR